MPSPTSFDRRASPARSSNRHSRRSTPSRSRSRSPLRRHRNDDRPKVSTGGFRWKDKSRDADNYDGPDERRLERGYRDRDRNDRYRNRDEDQDRESNRDRDPRRERQGDRAHREDSRRNRYSDRDRYDDRSSRRNDDTTPDRQNKKRDARSPTPDRDRTSTSTPTTKASKETSSKKAKPPKIAPTAQPMIIVNVNDRLGTKTAIPCLASDSIGDFKKLVGAHIGRKPHEIMLKRQGERPFKDILTLEDYGVSNGVQLDLEVDTGD
ncbi:MAG: hypothetical protein Q9209_005949 [Squamulea sp. 1 TL-2023]